MLQSWDRCRHWRFRTYRLENASEGYAHAHEGSIALQLCRPGKNSISYAFAILDLGRRTCKAMVNASAL